jgi:ribonuclease VapC
MFVDTSVMVGILASEADAGTLSVRLSQADRVYTSAIAIYEAVLGLARSSGLSVAEAEDAVGRFLEQSQAQIVPIDITNWPRRSTRFRAVWQRAASGPAQHG